MSIKLITKAWETPLKGNDLLVFIALADFANDDGELYPSYDKIMKKSKVGKTTLKYILKALEAIGVVHIEKRTRQNDSTASNYYKILTFDFTLEEYKEAYHKVRHYKQEKSQCDPHLESELVTPLGEIVTPQTPNCDPPIEPSPIEPSLRTVTKEKKVQKKRSS